MFVLVVVCKYEDADYPKQFAAGSNAAYRASYSKESNNIKLLDSLVFKIHFR